MSSQGKENPFKRVKIPYEWWICPYCGAEISAVAKEFHINYKHPEELKK